MKQRLLQLNLFLSEWKGRVPFTFCLSLSLLGGLTMPSGRDACLSLALIERITFLFKAFYDLQWIDEQVTQMEVLTRDSVTVAVDAVVYYRIKEPLNAVVRVADYSASTRLLAATTLRNVLGMRDLAQLLSDREAISHMMQSNLDEATDPWGVEVERVEIKDVRLPVQLQRAMAAEAEADREARAKIIAAEGEIKASRALREASLVMIDNPMALQLRYLQSLNTISAEKNSTIIFPFPMDFLKTFLHGPSPNAGTSLAV
ncbi:Mechanosensory protein 2 [Eumeta japonica]|uniref:Mechanosensory protein 2 n=1 Tax=Eumeta variegata TaxID=151549 RepID=A0A4C1ZAW6_EUMVA|nr:Mechanosensory protein 2 [Eumeta japonica]